MRTKIIFGGQEVPLFFRWKHIQFPKGQEIELHETGRKIKGITKCYLIGFNDPIGSIAYCSDQDTFCKFTGRKVSLTKVLEQTVIYKAERRKIWKQFLIENKKYIK